MFLLALSSLLMALSAISINVNGFRDADKRLSFLQWLSHLSPSVVCLQETHAITLTELSSWVSGFGYLCAGSFGSHRSCGVAVLFRPVLLCRSVVCEFDGRFVLAEFGFRGSVFRVACAYAPNRNPERDSFLHRCVDHIDPSIPTLLCGDFNTVFDRFVDRRGSCSFDTSRESSSLLSSVFRDCCVVDIWHLRHPSGSSFTWFRRDGSLASRIDLIGCPYAWIPFVSSADILPCPYSDHCALRFSWSQPSVSASGPGLWKLNTSVLEEAAYLQLISDFWLSRRPRLLSFPSVVDWWDAGKSRIKGITINYCKQRADRRRLERDILDRLVAHLKPFMDLGRVSLLPVYTSSLSRIQQLDLEFARGLQVRARIRWVEKGESSSAYFCRLVKKQSADRYISALRGSDGSLITDKDGLCDAFRSFYVDLFSSTPCDPVARNALLSHVSSSLSPGSSALCDGPLSQEECFTALKGMARGKTPGCDGLPMEFYLKFWSVLGSDLVMVLNSAFSSGRLSSSQRQGIITLSFKKDDRVDPKNWRPITLLNADYKIASCAIAARLLKLSILSSARIRLVGCRVALSVKMWPSFGTLLISVLVPVSWPPSSP